MMMPRSLGTLLLLLLLPRASGTGNSEEPRNVCLGIVNFGLYDSFNLNSTAKCFTKCGLTNDSCSLENLQRYWQGFEVYLVESSSTETVNTTSVKTLVRNFSTDTSDAVIFSLTPSQIPRQVMENENKPPDTVRLPRSFFGSFQGKRPMVRLAITILDIGSGNLFKGLRLSQEDGGSVLNNHLVGLSVGNTSVTGLDEPVEITFSHQPSLPNMTLTCAFWDVTKGDWSSKGCSTHHKRETTECHCDHLTFFALLLRPILDKATVQALTYISQAGCGASMLFLAFTVIFYTVLRTCYVICREGQYCSLPQPLLVHLRLNHKPGCTAVSCEPGLAHREELSPAPKGVAWQLRFSRQRFKSEDATKIHVALSISLFLLNLTFFIIVGSGSQGSNASCWARGAVFHYFLLCTFTWMGLEAFHLYLLILRVFNTYFGHYLLKLNLVGWGLPALVVICTGSANSYGHYSIHDEDNRITLELCWFHKNTALYVTVHGYFLITFLFSAVVLVLVAWKIFTLSSAMAGKEQGPNWKEILTVLGLSSLVGVTWGLAILTPLGLITVYIFAVLNSLQGVFIFCWFIVFYFPSQHATSSSSGTARVDQNHSVSRG